MDQEHQGGIRGEPQAPRPRILVVDDERFFREAIREALSEGGFDCIEVEDGEQALSLALDDSVGVMIVDIRLPGIDGIEVLRRVRELRPTLRVIMLSASTDQELVLEALRLGACDYLAKPLHDEELVLAVRRAAESYGVAHEWGNLRGRLDVLVTSMERLNHRARGLEGEARDEFLQAGAAEAAAEVLQAAKASLMLLNEDGTALEVAAAVGRKLEVTEMDAVPIGSGIAGAVLARCEPMVVSDSDADPRLDLPDHTDRYESNSFAVAPIESDDSPLGVLCVTDRLGGGVFGTDDLALIRLLAMQIADLMAVGRGIASAAHDPDPDSTLARSSGMLATAEATGADFDAELARLVCDAVVNEVEPERVIRAALEPLATGLSAIPVALYLVDSVSGELRLEGQCDGGLRSDRALLPKGRGLTGTVWQTGHLVATLSPEEDPRFDREADTPEDGVAGPMLCVPLRLRGKVVGVARAFLARDGRASARTGEVISAALSAAVRNVLLYRSLLESIEEVAEARRQSQPRR